MRDELALARYGLRWRVARTWPGLSVFAVLACTPEPPAEPFLALVPVAVSSVPLTRSRDVALVSETTACIGNSYETRVYCVDRTGNVVADFGREGPDPAGHPGTQSSKSNLEGLHPGAGGLVAALATASPAAPLQDRVPLRPATESFFESSDLPDLVELRKVHFGFFLPDTGLVLVDPTEIHIVDLASRETRVVGREGEGPEEFGRIAWAVRTPDGVAVWDILRYRVAFIARDGEFLRSQSYLDVPFKGFANVRPVAAHPDDRVLFRDETGGRAERFAGRVRHPAYLVAVGNDDSLKVVVEARGDEEYHGREISDFVIFGHRTLEAATGDRLIVAETDGEAITVFDWNGRQVADIPMSAGVRPSANQVRMAREVMVEEWERIREQVTKMSAEGRLPSPNLGDDFPTVPPDWPANEVAPPIDAMLTDFDSRLWVRDYRLPDQDTVTWRVWDVERTQLLFTARMDGEDTLLDARGEFVLLRRLDEFGVPRAVVSRLRAGGDQ